VQNSSQLKITITVDTFRHSLKIPVYMVHPYELPVSTDIGDWWQIFCLVTHYTYQTPSPTQPCTLCGMENEY